MDFPGGPVVNNLPGNAWNIGSIPGAGSFHLLLGTKACVPQLLKLTCSRA